MGMNGLIRAPIIIFTKGHKLDEPDIIWLIYCKAGKVKDLFIVKSLYGYTIDFDG